MNPKPSSERRPAQLDKAADLFAVRPQQAASSLASFPPARGDEQAFMQHLEQTTLPAYPAAIRTMIRTNESLYISLKR